MERQRSDIRTCSESLMIAEKIPQLLSGFQRPVDQDFVYLPTEDVYRCPAGERLTHRYTNEEDGKALRRYWTTACSRCPLKARCTTGAERRITRREHEHVLEAVQQRLDMNPQAMRVRRETAEHPFATLKMRMGALPDEDATARGHRDGLACIGLQSHAGHEHPRHSTALGGDEGVVSTTKTKRGEKAPLKSEAPE
jgi:hypothetical protein